MTKRIAGIIFIFLASTLGWVILGSTVLLRTHRAGQALGGQVQSIWGTPQVQAPPSASYRTAASNASDPAGGSSSTGIPRQKQRVIRLPLAGSDLNLNLALDYRRKGLLWYSTYTAEFSGDYRFRNPSDAAQTVRFCFPLPAKQAVYDDVAVTWNGSPVPFDSSSGALSGRARVGPGQDALLHVTYRSQGLDRWEYTLGAEVTHVRNFSLRITTNFGGFDFPENTLSPSVETRAGDGWKLGWKYGDLLSGFHIGLEMPEKRQPGPLAGRISFFAPVSLLFFFFVIFMLTMLRGMDFHPMNYFFLACAFFSFHLLLAYLVDRVPLEWSFLICSAVSLLLVWSYLRAAFGGRFALEAILAQFAYLILFSYAFFFEGFTGLTITAGAILTLGIVMQATAKIRWSEKFRKRTA